MSDFHPIFTERETACQMSLRALVSSVSKQIARFPRQTGFFIGKEEREAAYFAACRLLVNTEPLVASLRKAIAELIEAAGCAASCFARCDEWRSFYERTVTEFLSRIEETADFEQEGQRADPVRSVAVCSDFCRAAELFLKKQSDIHR